MRPLHAIASMFQGLPSPPTECIDALGQLDANYRKILADQLQAPLNMMVRGMNAKTVADMQAIVEYVNPLLERFGVGIECPDTGKPARLRLDYPPSCSPSAKASCARFMLVANGHDHATNVSHFYHNGEVPPLNLTAGEMSHAARVSKPAGRARG